MLPIRLGMVNAAGPQELFIYALTRKGRVETTNYRTVRLPVGRRGPALRQGRVRPLLQGDVQPAGRQARTCGRSSSSTPGTWAGAIPARPIRSPPTSCGSSASSGSTERADSARTPGAPERLPHPPPPALRLRALPRGPRLPGDRRPRELPGPLHPAPPLDGQGHLRGGARPIAASCPSSTRQQAETLASLTGWDVNKIRGRMNLKASTTQGASKDEPWWKQIWTD